jgi:hypothetical protein
MPDVPYSPVATARPGGAATPPIRIDTPLAAFGGAVAGAMQHLGATFESAGNQIWDRAIEIQKLKEETSAMQAATQFYINTGDSYEKFRQLEGRQPSEQLHGFTDTMEQSYQSARQGLSPYAQKLFDQDALRMKGYRITAAAAHAGDQLKTWANHEGAAATSSAIKTVGDGRDDAMFEEQLNKIDRGVDATPQWDPVDHPEENKFQKFQAKSEAWADRIRTLASSGDPGRAYKMMKDQIAAGTIRGDKIAQLEAIVSEKAFKKTATDASLAARTGAGWDYGAGIIPIDRAKVAIGTFESGNNYNNMTDSHTSMGIAFGKYQVMQAQLAEHLHGIGRDDLIARGADGKIDTYATGRNFLKDHAAQEAEFEKYFGDDMKKYGSFNEAASRWFSGRSVAEGIAKGVSDVNKTTVPVYLRQTNAILAKTATVEEKENIAGELAKRIDIERPEVEQMAKNQLRIDLQHENTAKHEQELMDVDLISRATMERGQDGKLKTTEDQILHGNGMAQASWDRMSERDKATVRRQLIRNITGDESPTRESTNEFRRLYGAGTDHEASAEDRAALLNTRVLDLPNTPWEEKQKLLHLQEQLRKNIDADPRITPVVKYLEGKGMLDDFDKDQKNHLRGVLRDAIESIQGEERRPLTPAEMEKVGLNAMRQSLQETWGSYLHRGWLSVFGSPEDQAKAAQERTMVPTGPVQFEKPVPDEELTKMRRSIGDERFNAMTDRQKQDLYTAKMLGDLYEQGKERLKTMMPKPRANMPVPSP